MASSSRVRPADRLVAFAEDLLGRLHVAHKAAPLGAAVVEAAKRVRAAVADVRADTSIDETAQELVERQGAMIRKLQGDLRKALSDVVGLADDREAIRRAQRDPARDAQVMREVLARGGFGVPPGPGRPVESRLRGLDLPARPPEAPQARPPEAQP